MGISLVCACVHGFRSHDSGLCLICCHPLCSGIGVLIFKAVLFGLFMSYPQPGEDLKWKRAPSLPMQELSRRFARGSSRKSDRSLPRGRVIGGGKTRPEPAIPARSDGSSSKLDFPHPEVQSTLALASCITCHIPLASCLSISACYSD